LPQTLLDSLNTRDIEWIISPLTGNDVGCQRHPQRVKDGLHDLDLGQVWAVILAMAKLKQALFAHTRIGACTGAIDVDTLRSKIIDANQMWIKSRFKRRPTLVITELTQDNLKPIIVKFMGSHGLTAQMAQSELSLGHPGLDMDQAMITSRENRAEPDRYQPAESETLPVAVGGKMGVK
jgi:hypothetical protein